MITLDFFLRLLIFVNVVTLLACWIAINGSAAIVKLTIDSLKTIHEVSLDRAEMLADLLNQITSKEEKSHIKRHTKYGDNLIRQRRKH